MTERQREKKTRDTLSWRYGNTRAIGGAMSSLRPSVLGEWDVCDSHASWQVKGVKEKMTHDDRCLFLVILVPRIGVARAAT